MRLDVVRDSEHVNTANVGPVPGWDGLALKQISKLCTINEIHVCFDSRTGCCLRRICN